MSPGPLVRVTIKSKQFAALATFDRNKVEVTRVELVSKHILQKPSTCLFYFSVSGINWE
jgi:hypothetical protein